MKLLYKHCCSEKRVNNGAGTGQAEIQMYWIARGRIEKEIMR